MLLEMESAEVKKGKVRTRTHAVFLIGYRFRSSTVQGVPGAGAQKGKKKTPRQRFSVMFDLFLHSYKIHEGHSLFYIAAS